MKGYALVGLVSLAAAPPTAFAVEDSGFYLEAEGGVTRADTRKNDFDEIAISTLEGFGIGVVSGESSLDDRDTTFGVTVGYRANPYLAIEASYVDLGSVKYRAEGELTDGFVIVPGTFDVTRESSGAAVSALAFWPQDRYELFARLGVYFADNEAKVTVSADGESESESGSDSTEEFFWGVGGSWLFADRWSLRLEYREFADVGDSNGLDADVSTLSLGAVYRF